MTMSKAKRKRRNQAAAARDRALGLPPRRRCNWCERPVTFRDVRVGNGRTVRLLVGLDPAPDGVVYRDADGEWRLMRNADVGMDPPKFVPPPRFYFHGAAECLLTGPVRERETRLERLVREAVEFGLLGSVSASSPSGRPRLAFHD